MLALDIFLYIWLCLICCMCSHLCYEEHQQRNPNTRFNFIYVKRKLSVLFGNQEPVNLNQNLVEMTGSYADLEAQPDDPPDWVRGD